MIHQEAIGKMLDDLKVVFISSVDEDGFPNTKAMLGVRERDGLKHIYFSTNTSSKKVSQFQQNPKGCIYFCDANRFIGVMLKGEVEVHFDETHRKRLWREGDTMFYPQGLNDPDYCVLKFTIQSARIYSNFVSEDFAI